MLVHDCGPRTGLLARQVWAEPVLGDPYMWCASFSASVPLMRHTGTKARAWRLRARGRCEPRLDRRAEVDPGRARRVLVREHLHAVGEVLGVGRIHVVGAEASHVTTRFIDPEPAPSGPAELSRVPADCRSRDADTIVAQSSSNPMTYPRSTSMACRKPHATSDVDVVAHVMASSSRRSRFGTRTVRARASAHSTESRTSKGRPQASSSNRPTRATLFRGRPVVR